MLVPVIGLEIHCELDTNAKVFCTCRNEFGNSSNTQVCPVCAGLPGTLPVLNRKAVEYTARAGLALGCTVSHYAEFDRKNYFYPDLPKAYQISQLYHPLCVNGSVTIGSGKVIRLNRIHLEEDAGKLLHDAAAGLSLVDYNRCGVPLIEIVTEPDISSAEEATEFVRQVARRLRYAGVSDCKMEQGSLRVDVNISLKEESATRLGERAEVKNLNSLKSVGRAIAFEIQRQKKLLESGQRVVQETRSWNDNTERTRSLRSKEDAHDYRYFKDPDILPVRLTDQDVQRIAAELPAMPEQRFQTYTGAYGLSAVDADNLLEFREISDFYEACLKDYDQPKKAAAFILVEVFRVLKEQNQELPAFPASHLAYLLTQMDAGKVTRADAKQVLQQMAQQAVHPKTIIAECGYGVEDDAGAVDAAVGQVLESCSQAVEQYLAGETKVFGFLMGQCNQKLKGKASPALIKERLQAALSQPVK